MRTRVERLRIWLLVSALVLMVVLAAFMGWARYLRRHYLAGLPARLGMNIVRDTDGFTDCQTLERRTIYCMHAAKMIEHTGGKIALHNVSVTFYGKNGGRNDRIYGDEFEYDKNAQVVRATGLVHIDLEAAEAAGGTAVGGSIGKVTHVTTSGLVYVRTLGIAATSDAIEFEAGGMKGHAVGADYSSDSGMLLLHSAVTMSGTAGGHAVAMTAATAQFDEHSEQAVMTHATYESEGRRVAADEATLDRRKDGTLSRIRALGNVTMEAKGAKVTSQRAEIALTASSKPQTAVLTGAVRYGVDQALRQVHGLADEATVAFDSEANPQPKDVVFTGGVHLTERTGSRARASAPVAWSMRDLTAGKVEASLIRGAAGEAQVRDVEAMGNPRLSVVDSGAAKGGSTTELAADDLKAHMIDTGDAKRQARVDTIAGRGHTLLRQVTADGGEQTVMADSLDAKMKPMSVVAPAKVSGAKVGAAAGSAGDKLADSLWSSVQQGHVTMMQRVPAKVNAKGMAVGASVEHALADRAVYDGDLDRMTLSDGVQVSDEESVVWAKEIVLDHKTGDAHAVGGVKVSYAGSASAGTARADAPPVEATHVLADRGDMVHASGVATFYGRPVRLWQGGNQVQAPVIELSNAEKRMVARGDGTGGAAQVHTVLAKRVGNAGASGSGAAGRGCDSSAVARKGGAGTQADGVTRIESGGLIYSGGMGQADFTGGFSAETEAGTILANQAVAYMQQGKASKPTNGAALSEEAATPAAGGPSFSGELARVVATGGVELDRPGLKATGKQLVYTAEDGTAVLTGDARTPPKAVGEQGTTTGDALRFSTSCGGSGSVEVVGGSGQRVHTDATMSDRKKSERGK